MMNDPNSDHESGADSDTGPNSEMSAFPDSDRDSGRDDAPWAGADLDLSLHGGPLDGNGIGSSVTYETEAETVAPAAKVTRVRRAAGSPKPAAQATPQERFPGVFGGGAKPTPPAAAPAPAMTFDAPSADNTPLPSIPGAQAGRRTASVGNWSIHTIAELVRFRDEITRQLPATELSKLNLEEEVLLQYHVLRELQADVLATEDIPANQRAQVANSVASILKTLADQQVALYSSERFKEIENLLIRTLTLLPEAQASSFIVEYERILQESSKK